MPDASDRALLPTLLAGAAALGIWSAGAALAQSPVLPGPSAVARAAAEQLADGTLIADGWASLRRVLIGYSLAAAAGLSLGAATALAGRWGAGPRRVLELLRPIPPIAWVPLAILWLGLGDASAWFIVFIGAFFPIYIQVVWGLASCPEPWLELARSLGASRRMILLRVRLPAAAPQVAAGLRVGLGLAWISVIAAELVGAQSGLGYRIQLHRLMLETEGVIVGMLTIGLMGYAMGAAARWLERRLLPWGAP